MLNRKMKPIAAAVGAAFAASLTAGAMADESAAADPFEAELLQGVVLADAHGGEGKCGEGDGEAKCGEGEGSGDGDEAKCGEGKCGEGDGEGEESSEEVEEE